MTQKRKDLPSASASNFPQRLREAVQTYLGRQGDPLDRGITLRDLLESGVARLRAGLSPTTGSGALPIESAFEVPAYEPDLTPPPQPGALTATGGVSHVFVEHEPPIYAQGHGHLRTRVYGVTVADGDPLPTFSDAVEVGQFTGVVWPMPSDPGTTWRLWAKWESNDGVLSATPAGGTNGVEAITPVHMLLDVLAGQITSSELDASLATPIALINMPTSGVVARLDAHAALIGSIQTEIAELASTPEYDSGESYIEGQVVRYDGGLYRALVSTTGNLPTDTDFWELIGNYDSLGEAVAAHTVILGDHDSRIGTVEGGLVAEVAASTALAAVVAANTAAVATEATARADADGALSSTIAAVSAVANARNKTFRQTDAPSSGMLAGDIWYDSDDGNKAYRYSGSAWVVTDDARIASTAAAVTTEAAARAAADTALAGQITTLTSTVNGNTSAISAEASTRASQTGELYAQFTVKTDVAGLVSGYGLASSANNAAPTSSFGVRASSFFVAPPAIVQGTAPTSNRYAGMVWLDNSVTPNVTRYWTGSAWTTVPQALPFVIQTAPTTINGETVPPGVYMDNVFMARLVATRGQIGLLAVDDARIASVAVGKLVAGSISVGEYLQSTGYVAGSSGWRINGNGSAEFSGVVVRGTIYASAGQIGGSTIGSTYIRSTNYVLNASGWSLNSDGTGQIGGFAVLSTAVQSTNFVTGSTGWRLKSDGNFEANGATFRGNVIGSQFTTGNFVGYVWPPAGGVGSYFGPSGLLLGNANDGRYFQVTNTGNLYAPGFSVVNGVLTISQANVINTLNLAGNAVTIPSSASSSSAVTAASVPVTLQSVTYTSTGAPVFVFFSCTVTPSYVMDGSNLRQYLRVLRNGLPLREVMFVQVGIGSGHVACPPILVMSLTDTPVSGSVTYSVEVTTGSAWFASTSHSNRSLLCLEVKR